MTLVSILVSVLAEWGGEDEDLETSGGRQTVRGSGPALGRVAATAGN